MDQNNLIIREISSIDVELMEDIMYEAIYHPDKDHPYPKEVIYLPQVSVYWKHFGTGKDDLGLFAFVGDIVAGAVWTRTFPDKIKGCGYINDETPELAIALFDTYRGKGIGTCLMNEMIRLLKTKGCRQVSLSITKGNPAIRLYERLGFKLINENEEDYIMLLKLM